MHRLNSAIPDSFHHAAFLVLHILYPVGFPRCYQHMRIPAFDVAIQLVILFDLESSGILDVAAFAVMITVFAVDGRIDLRKERGSGGGFGKAITELGDRGRR